MTFSFDLLSAAEADMDSAARWYELQRRGLGREFVLCVENTFESMQHYPAAYPSVGDQFRRALVRRFPYVVYFRFDGQSIKVYAVMHTHRHPAEWKRRID